MVYNRKTAQLVNCAYGRFIVARSAEKPVAVIDKPAVDVRVVKRRGVVFDSIRHTHHFVTLCAVGINLIIIFRIGSFSQFIAKPVFCKAAVGVKSLYGAGAP